MPGLRLFQFSATGATPLPGTSVPNDITRAFCAGGENVAPEAATPGPGQVVSVCGACALLAIVVGVPRPPPSCPRITIEVGTGSALVRLIVSVSPATTTMVGPGAQALAQAPPAGVAQ